MKCTFLLEDHDAFRQALAKILEREPDIEVDGQAKTLDEALKLASEGAGQIDLAVVDLLLPDGLGVDLIRQLRKQRPELPVLVLTAARETLIHDWARAIGATEVLTKDVSLKEIIATIRGLGER